MDDVLRIWVAADDPLARAGLAALLAGLPGLLVVGQDSAATLPDVAAGDADAQANLILWDTGLELDGEPFDEPFGRAVPVVALVAEAGSAAEAWRMGCRGILSRGLDVEALPAALAAVAAGLVVVSPVLAGALAARAQEPEPGDVELTPRETAVLALLAEGLTNKAIAQRLGISDHTVKFHVNAILSKLDAQSRTDAVVRATRRGLLSL
jgi:DNA-binding NarL/FixJ family response regulator